MSEHTTLARRHLLTAFGIGVVALRSKLVHAQPIPPNGDDLDWPPLQANSGPPPWYTTWGFIADVGIGHYTAFYGTPYPQDMFNQLVASSGPPPKSIYDSINAAPIQKGSPLSIPPVSWTFSYPGYLPSGPGIENNADYWPPLQSVPPWAQTWGLTADEIGHYQGQFGALSQAQFNQIIASSGPPPEGALDTIIPILRKRARH
jgi:hypothetical protein